MAEKKITITIDENGPFAVTGLSKIHNADGKDIEVDDTVYLCRCGASSNKPFCDGSHFSVGFSGERVSERPMNKERDYEGADITIHDNRGICSHAAVCVAELGGVFKLGERPWIDPDGAEAQAIMDFVHLCPSGALSYTTEGKRVEASPTATEVEIEKGGPYYVSGDVEFVSELQPPNPRRFALCRCGKSKNKPFCDGRHHDIEFD